MLFLVDSKNIAEYVANSRHNPVQAYNTQAKLFNCIHIL